jgi:hypothetical protein
VPVTAPGCGARQAFCDSIHAHLGGISYRPQNAFVLRAGLHIEPGVRLSSARAFTRNIGATPLRLLLFVGFGLVPLRGNVCLT